VGALSESGGDAAATAIMTTDTVPKTVVVERQGWTIGGMAKGAGMLAPGLATMLVVLTTDANLDVRRAQGALRESSRVTFDRTDSDGCMSTNDTVILLASGASGVTPEPDAFEAALTEACGTLARALIADAEGASHDISIIVEGATTEAAAEAVARAVARSNLFKAAIFGGDPNWGRIVAAVGTVPEEVAPYDPAFLDVSVNGVQVCRAQGVGEDRNLVDLAGREVTVVIDLHAGGAVATIWTNDLTHDYVHENSAYSS
jgi:glutamate N-acetyltransferase/amino-acid N-acetyltransferase